jgi:hypothetical protein
MQYSTFGLLGAMILGILIPNMLKDIYKMQRKKKYLLLTTLTAIIYASFLLNPMMELKQYNQEIAHKYVDKIFL